MTHQRSSFPQSKRALQAMVAQQQSTIAQQNQTISQLSQKLSKLEHYLEQLVRARYGPRSEKVDSRQQLLFDSMPEAGSTPAKPAPASVEVQPHRRRKGGRMELPPHLTRKVVEHDLSECEKPCPGCGELRQRMGAEVSEQLEFIPASLLVLQHVRHKYACRRCKEHVAVAPAAAKPIPKGLPGPGLLAALVVGKYADHLPLYRLEDAFVRSGIELSRSTLCRWALHTAKILRPLYEVMVAEVLQSRVIHTDDTPMPVLDESLPHTRTARLWVYAGDWRHPHTVYDYTTSRRRDGPMEFLQDFSGYLQADAYGGYEGIYAHGRVKQVLCWAHARRKFHEARQVQPEEAHAALAYIARLYAVEQPIALLRVDLQEDANIDQIMDEWFTARRAHRQEQALPILQEMHDWLTRTQADVLPKSPVGQAIGYVLPRWDGLTRYCEDGMLAIDNNLSERMIRPCAIGRKNYLFFGSDEGGMAAAVLYSLMASAKSQHVEPFAYLRDLITVLTEAPNVDLRTMLPAPWLARHPDARRNYSR